MYWRPEDAARIDEAGYAQFKRHALEWLPASIIDMHVHTPLDLQEKPERSFHQGLLDIYFKHKPRITPKNFSSIFPGKGVGIVGFPLTYKEAVPWKANQFIVEQGIDALLIDDDISRLRSLAKGNVRGIKMHHKIMNTGSSFTEMATREKMELLESRGMCLLIEVPDPMKEIDSIIEAASSYKVNIILPHMAFNHTGFHMKRSEFEKSFQRHKKEYDILERLSEHENIYLDIAMKVDYDLIKTGIELLGDKRILYGTDYPYCFTPKITEEREMWPGMFEDMVDIVVSGKEDWRYFKNIYLLVWVLEQVCEGTGARKDMILRKNAERAILKKRK